jgi:hypothetical protein
MKILKMVTKAFVSGIFQEEDEEQGRMKRLGGKIHATKTT